MMKKNEKNKVILGQDDSLEPSNSAESRNCHYRDCEAITDNLSRIKKGKALSLRGGLMSDEAIFQAETNSVQRLLSRCCKNVEDCRVSAMHFLAMTPITLILAAVFTIANISESWAESRYEYDDNGNIVKRTYYPCSNGICNKQDEHLYTYDQNGKKSREYYYVCSGGECPEAYTVEYSYYTDGNTVKEQQHLISEQYTSLSQTIYTYNESGDITREEHYHCPYGNCIKDNEDIYTYENGKRTKREYFGDCSSGTCKKGEEYIYTYDSNDNMTKEERYYCNYGTCNKSSINNYTYDYDEFGNIINKYKNGELEEAREYSDGYYVKLENECNQAGNCKACTKWSTLEGTRCVPGYEWIDDETLAINDDLPEITRDIIGLGSGMPEKILCRGDVAKCKELLRNYPIYSGGGNPYGYGSSDYYPGYSAPYGGEYLNVDLGDYVEPATEANCETSKYYWSGSSCNNKSGGINCDENFKQMETWCNRIRYTPADAAKVLKDTDNEIVMTFKVNR